MDPVEQGFFDLADRVAAIEDSLEYFEELVFGIQQQITNLLEDLSD
jgi:hypothetical protein